MPLAHHFLAQQRPGLRFSSEAAEKLRGYGWPGNVRELKNVGVRAAVFAAGPEVATADLPEEFLQDAFSAGLYRCVVLPELEKSAILEALRENGGHQERAAARLGIFPADPPASHEDLPKLGCANRACSGVKSMERRREKRAPGSGIVEIAISNPAPLTIQAALVETSASGFRASHDCQALEPGVSP